MIIRRRCTTDTGFKPSSPTTLNVDSTTMGWQRTGLWYPSDFIEGASQLQVNLKEVSLANSQWTQVTPVFMVVHAFI